MRRFSGRVVGPGCGVWVIAFLGISLIAAAGPSQTPNREAQAWRDVVRVLDPARSTSRITDVGRLIHARPPGLSKVLAYLGEHEPDSEIQGEALLGLARLKDPSTEPALRRIRAKLGEPNPQGPDDDRRDGPRIYALVAIYRITREPALRDQILLSLRSPSMFQASSAIGALSLLREAEVREALYALIAEGDYLLSCQAADDLLDEQNTPEVRQRTLTAINARPVVGMVQGKPIRGVCLDEVLARLRRHGKRLE